MIVPSFFLTAALDDFPSFDLTSEAVFPDPDFEADGACLTVEGARDGLSLAPRPVPGSAFRRTGGRRSEASPCSRSPVGCRLG